MDSKNEFIQSIKEFRILEDYLIETCQLKPRKKRYSFNKDIKNLLKYIPPLICEISVENCQTCKLNLHCSHDCKIEWEFLVERYFKEALQRFREKFYNFIDCETMLEDIKFQIKLMNI